MLILHLFQGKFNIWNQNARYMFSSHLLELNAGTYSRQLFSGEIQYFNGKKQVFFSALFVFLSSPFCRCTILWLVCVFAKYQKHASQTSWCIPVVVLHPPMWSFDWYRITPLPAKKFREKIHNSYSLRLDAQKGYKLATGCPFGVE